MKIDVKQVLLETAAFYRVNLKYLIGVSLLFCVWMISFTVMIYIPIELNPILFIFMFVLAVAILVFIPKLVLVMPILINSIFEENRVTLKDAFNQTKGKYWTVVGRIMLIALIWSAPYVVLLFTEIPFVPVIGVLYFGFVSSLYYMLIPTIALEPKTKNYLKKSIQMIKGNYIPILILRSITITLLSALNITLMQVLDGNTTALLIAEITYWLVYLFVLPFSEIVIVILYRQLAKFRHDI